MTNQTTTPPADAGAPTVDPASFLAHPLQAFKPQPGDMVVLVAQPLTEEQRAHLVKTWAEMGGQYTKIMVLDEGMQIDVSLGSAA